MSLILVWPKTVFKNVSQTFSKADENQTKQADGETDKRFWDTMLNADRKDYEHICTEFGVADIDLALKKLEEKRRERVQAKCQV